MMGQRSTKRVLFAFVVWACLFPLSLARAEAPTLTFPHLATGEGIDFEINLTNPAPHIESGHVLFFDDTGKPMPLLIDGKLTSRADFSLPASGTKKLRIDGTDELQVGYAFVMTDNAASSLVGNLVFTVKGLFDLSVPDCRATTSARLFVERNQEVNSGYAVLNRDDRAITVSFLVRDQNGLQIGEKSIDLGPGEKASRFLDFVGVPEFIGSLEASSDSPFYILGLRQRPTGSVAALPAAVASGPVVGSQLLYFLDSGIDLTAGGYSQQELSSKTVYELTGLKKAANSTAIKITNNNRSHAVTVQVYFLNDKGQDYLDFLLVLKCGETLVFDPFDFQLPGVGDLKTSNFLFGHDLPTGLAADKRLAAQFGSGRFVLSVLAVGVLDANADSTADVLYPNEVAMIGLCGVTPRNTGSQPGLSPANLHVFNALPMVFDYLSGNHVYTPAGLDGPIFSADAILQALSIFTRTRVPMQGIYGQKGYLTLADPGNSDLLKHMEGRKGQTAGTVVLPSTAVLTWGSAPFTFLAKGR